MKFELNPIFVVIIVLALVGLAGFAMYFGNPELASQIIEGLFSWFTGGE